MVDLLLMNCPSCKRAIGLKAEAGEVTCPNCNEGLFLHEESVIVTELKNLLEKHRDTAPWYVIEEFEEVIEKIEAILKEAPYC